MKQHEATISKHTVVWKNISSCCAVCHEYISAFLYHDKINSLRTFLICRVNGKQTAVSSCVETFIVFVILHVFLHINSEWLWSEHQDPACAHELSRDCYYWFCVGLWAVWPDRWCHTVTRPTVEPVWGELKWNSLSGCWLDGGRKLHLHTSFSIGLSNE